MTQLSPVIIWFRNDLRLLDNPALAAAAGSGRPVICLYVFDETPGIRPIGTASRWWLNKSLSKLASDLVGIGARLILRRGLAAEELLRIARQSEASAIYWNRIHDPDRIARDSSIKRKLRQAGLEVNSYNSSLLNEPWEVLKKDGTPFQVFTAYWRAAQGRDFGGSPFPRPSHNEWCHQGLGSDLLEDWRLEPPDPGRTAGFGDWRPGEQGALQRLHDFLDGGLDNYVRERNSPAAHGTSRLSPHLHFGEIAPRQIARSLSVAISTRPSANSAVEAFERQLAWREFNRHLLFHNSGIPTSSLKKSFDRFPWRDDPLLFSAWKTGSTGYPIVDAGMRELWATGWMHNRVRMIAASFLTKHLMIDWRHGEAWFWDTLVDADLANNVNNWQWIAGCGADAAPYFRIFNPGLQSTEHDPTGDYIRRWAPELRKLPNRFIHEPWKASPMILADSGIRLGRDYPAPIVDHGEARRRALDAYRNLTQTLDD